MKPPKLLNVLPLLLSTILPSSTLSLADSFSEILDKECCSEGNVYGLRITSSEQDVTLGEKVNGGYMVHKLTSDGNAALWCMSYWGGTAPLSTPQVLSKTSKSKPTKKRKKKAEKQVETPESWEYGYWDYDTTQVFRDGWNGFTNLTDGSPSLAMDGYVDCGDHAVSMLDFSGYDQDGFTCCMSYPLNNNVDAWLGQAVKPSVGASLVDFKYDAVAFRDVNVQDTFAYQTFE
ncbi:hypothetical protein TrRE_jg8746, partial [Triparma retinervis]